MLGVIVIVSQQVYMNHYDDHLRVHENLELYLAVTGPSTTSIVHKITQTLNEPETQCTCMQQLTSIIVIIKTVLYDVEYFHGLTVPVELLSVYSTRYHLPHQQPLYHRSLCHSHQTPGKL